MFRKPSILVRAVVRDDSIGQLTIIYREYLKIRRLRRSTIEFEPCSRMKGAGSESLNVAISSHTLGAVLRSFGDTPNPLNRHEPTNVATGGPRRCPCPNLKRELEIRQSIEGAAIESEKREAFQTKIRALSEEDWPSVDW